MSHKKTHTLFLIVIRTWMMNTRKRKMMTVEHLEMWFSLFGALEGVRLIFTHTPMLQLCAVGQLLANS